MAKSCSLPPAIDEDLDDVDHALWCYAKMDDPRASAETAPSRGTWAMLCWARDERSRFYTSVFPRALLAQVKAEIEEVERYKRGEFTDEELADSDEKEMQRAWLKGIGVTDEFMVEVEDVVTEWQRQMGIELPEECAEDLSLAVADYVQTAINVTKRYPKAFAAQFERAGADK